MAAEAGIENPTDEDLRRFDKKRTEKKVSNDDWQSPSDPDSRIAKMKDGCTHLAYKAEHVVDLKTDLVLSAVVYEANRADAETMAESVVQAKLNIIEADKDYHSADTLALLNGPLGMRTYPPEPQRSTTWKWSQRPAEQQAAVVGNRRRVRGQRGKRLQRGSSELTERSFAHVCETGGALLVARAGPSDQTLSVASRSAKPEFDHAQTVRSGHATRLAIPGRSFVACGFYPESNRHAVDDVLARQEHFATSRTWRSKISPCAPPHARRVEQLIFNSLLGGFREAFSSRQELRT
jgi:hypothetical protein